MTRLAALALLWGIPYAFGILTPRVAAAVRGQLETAPCGAYVSWRELGNVTDIRVSADYRAGLKRAGVDHAPPLELTRWADCRRRRGHRGAHRGPVEIPGRMTGGRFRWERTS